MVGFLRFNTKILTRRTMICASLFYFIEFIKSNLSGDLNHDKKVNK